MAANNGVIKLIVLGANNTGKTSLIYSINEGTFKEQITSVNYLEKNYSSPKGNFKVMIYDSDKESSGLGISSIESTRDGVLLVYASNVRDSYKEIESWVGVVENKMPKAPIMILANKSDLNSSEVKFSTAHVKYNGRGNVIGFMETSCKSGANVEQAYGILIEKIISLREDDKLNMLNQSNYINNNTGFNGYDDNRSYSICPFNCCCM